MCGIFALRHRKIGFIPTSEVSRENLRSERMHAGSNANYKAPTNPESRLGKEFRFVEVRMYKNLPHLTDLSGFF
jgi:hypothetical protein